MVFPSFSGRRANWAATKAAAPEEMPTSSPSFLASSRPVRMASSLLTSTTSSTMPASKVSGTNPAPMPCILCGPASPPFNTGVYITEGYNIQGSIGETITFRLYDHSSQSELDVVSNYSIVFQANQNIGNAVNPQYIDFYTMSSSYYMLITDESQLVEGRKYLIASGFDGTAMAVGGPLEGGTISEGVEITCANKKTNQSTPAVPAQGYVFQFTMGQYNDLWTLYDGVNMNFLVTDESGDLKT